MSRIRLIALALGMLAFLGACAADEDPTLTEPEATATAPADETAPAGEATVTVSDSDLGQILVDGDGVTVYAFANDSAGQSTCTDECAQNWPPLTVDGDAVAGPQVDASLLGTIEREDGSTQVTYDEQPLYHYAGDQAAGDTNGQGVGGVWWVVGPDGAPIEE